MDYKKIIRSRAARENILRALAFIPDEAMLRIQYRIKTGRALHLKHPTRFTEKLQWYKLYYRDPDMLRCVDKYEVRAYLRERGFQDLLPRCFGVFDPTHQPITRSIIQPHKSIINLYNVAITLLPALHKAKIPKGRKKRFICCLILKSKSSFASHRTQFLSLFSIYIIPQILE